MRHAAVLAAAALLQACGNSVPTLPGDGARDATGLCLSCGRPFQLVDLPQLENVLVTDDGRVFLTGQSNLYELHRDADGGYGATALLADGTGCSGLAQYRRTVFALCSGGSGPTDMSALMAIRLDERPPLPRRVFQLSGMSLPNGMAATDGALYVTDGPIAVEPKIVRLDFDPADPETILGQQTWLPTFPDYPNGLVIDGDHLYTTLYRPGIGGSVARIEIRADGSAGTLRRVAARGIMDDLALIGDWLVVTDWQGNALFAVDREGRPLDETEPGTFAQPSAVALAGPPLFDEPVLLVTERYTGNGVWVLPMRP